MKKTSRHALPLGLFLVLSLFACGEETTDPREECISQELLAQQSQRVALGATHYLPMLDPSCEAQGWVVAGGPDGAGGDIIQVEGSFSRFTPRAPGAYRLEVPELGLVRELAVIPAAGSPFEHYNYYQGDSAAIVGDELWIAAVYSPEIIRLNPTTLAELGRIPVGPWPVAVSWKDGMTHAVVAHKAGDTVGFVDVDSKVLVDAVWVGDEPANLVVSGDGEMVYVALSTEGAVAILDVATRTLLRRVETNFDPFALALDEGRRRLFVASHRSGDDDRYPFEDDPRTSAFDVAVLNLDTFEVDTWLESVGSTIGGLSIEGDRLFVATTRTTPVDLGRVVETPFMHQVAVYKLDDLSELARTDLTDQESSTGPVVSPRGLTVAGGLLWVTAEGVDQAVVLDPVTLEERARLAAPGRPRGILSRGDTVYIHGAQGYAVTRAAADGSESESVQLGGDPRPVEVQRGQVFFTGSGDGFGSDHSCNSCHMDALMDGNIWPAGPFRGFYETRPYFWIEGTSPLGWEGYHENARMFAYTVINPTVGAEPNTQLAEDLTRYVSAIVPPPAANGLTNRDGTMTDAALRGLEVFDGKAACAACHSGHLLTNQRVLDESGTVEGHIDTPSLVSIYRHGYWLADGSARSVDEAVDMMLRWTGITNLSESERSDLVRYVEELTSRDFFLLDSEPAAGTDDFGADQPLRLIFSHSVYVDSGNLSLVRLVDESGAPVDGDVSGQGRYVTFTPKSSLTAGSAYRLELGEAFEAFNTSTLTRPVTLEFVVAQAPSLRLEGEYAWTVDHPGLDFGNMRVAPDTPIETTKIFTATPTASGADIIITLNDVTEVESHVVVAGDQLLLPALPVAIGNGAELRMSAGWSTQGTLIDDDGDGVADRAEGTMRVSGPTYNAEGMRWGIQRDDPNAVDLDECDAMLGDNEVVTIIDGETLSIDWAEGLEAIAVYVSEPSAEPPLGPGPMTGGEAYWIVQSEQFPTGFAGPVVYGTVPDGAQDVTVGSGGPDGGAELPVQDCIKVTVVFTDFSSSKRFVRF